VMVFPVLLSIRLTAAYSIGFRVKESITCPESFPVWENAKAGQKYNNSIKSFRTGKQLNDYFFTSFKNLPLPSKIRSLSSTSAS
jgi:hypothetical protein